MPASMPIRKTQHVDALRAGVDEGGVGGVVEGVEGFAGGEEFEAEGLHLAAGGGVGDDTAAAMSATTRLRVVRSWRDVPDGVRERRDDDEAALRRRQAGSPPVRTGCGGTIRGRDTR